jgi:two-component system, NtrC family, response regulator AtoC
MPEALIVEDDAQYALAVSELIQGEDFQVSICGTIEEASAYLKVSMPDVVLVDLVLPDGSGIDLIHHIEALASHTRVLVITGHAAVESTVAALRAGVQDFLTKPLDIEQLRSRLSEIKAEVAKSDRPSASSRHPRDRLGMLIGSSPVMRELFRQIDNVAPTQMTVFLFGESGTGKELAASAIHELSTRAERPFLAINCGAVPTNLIASELFGHERGSFTDARSQHKGYFERAEGGTLFLDEITEMPLELQVQLLRVLENRTITRLGGHEEIPVNVRVIAATNRHPREAVAEGRLREDLLFRLMVFPINLPPLRRRFSDIPILAEEFLERENQRHGTRKTFSPETMESLMAYSWPGNVRELKNAIGHAYILANDKLQPEHFPEGLDQLMQEDGPSLRCTPGTPIDQFERRFILATLEHYHGNKRRTAETLGISLKTLYNRLNEYRSEG